MIADSATKSASASSPESTNASSTPAPSFAQVAVSLPVAGTYHYAIPAGLHGKVDIGDRVSVRFGARKVTGIVVGVGDIVDTSKKILPIEEVQDRSVRAQKEVVTLALWLADYYQAPPGEAMRCALPSGATSGQTVAVTASDAGKHALANAALPGAQRDLLASLVDHRRQPNSLPPAQRKWLSVLREQGWIIDAPLRLTSRSKPRKEWVARIADGLDVVATLASLAKSKAKLNVIRSLQAGPIPHQALTAAGCSAAALRELIKLGTVTSVERLQALQPLDNQATAHQRASDHPIALPILTDEQQHAVTTITSAVGFAPFLLFGITGSGKTEVYLRVIAEVLARGQTAIVLVPEISLTPQLSARFAARFGAQVAVLHSGLSERDRHDEWQRLRTGAANIAVGARSAVFAPVTNLGIIVVDEEHDSSFKQEEGVRYHARDVALVRAQRAGAVCVMGSATPSLESYWQTERGTCTKLTLTKRPTANSLPTVEIVDLIVHRPDAESMLSARLRTAVEETLAAGDQCVLFLNRRGFATFVLCKACGHSFRCDHCSVSLTYHKFRDQLVCHYCGFTARVPDNCPSCKQTGSIDRRGLGTEKIADAVAAQFPSARVARLDRDTAGGKRLEEILASVEQRRIDILVGTQMVSKGHDFPGVTLVGVLCADTGLSLPDFRAGERTYQLLSQVAGRAGRGAKPGRVMIQTYRAQALAITAAARHDYAGFYAGEMAARLDLGYPPHGRLIAVRMDGPDAAQVAEVANRLANYAAKLGQQLPDVEVTGPVAAPLEKLRGRVRWQIWIRGPKRAEVRQVARAVLGAEVPSAVRVSLDVDPMSTL